MEKQELENYEERYELFLEDRDAVEEQRALEIEWNKTDWGSTR